MFADAQCFSIQSLKQYKALNNYLQQCVAINATKKLAVGHT